MADMDETTGAERIESAIEKTPDGKAGPRRKKALERVGKHILIFGALALVAGALAPLPKAGDGGLAAMRDFHPFDASMVGRMAKERKLRLLEGLGRASVAIQVSGVGGAGMNLIGLSEYVQGGEGPTPTDSDLYGKAREIESWILDGRADLHADEIREDARRIRARADLLSDKISSSGE